MGTVPPSTLLTCDLSRAVWGRERHPLPPAPAKELTPLEPISLPAEFPTEAGPGAAWKSPSPPPTHTPRGLG